MQLWSDSCDTLRSMPLHTPSAMGVEMMPIAQAITPDLIDRVPIAGGAAVLIVIIGIVTKLWLGSESRHRAELDRIGKAHIAEIQRYEQQVITLRAEVAELDRKFEAERQARRDAEDVAYARRRRHDHRGERGETNER